MRAIKECPSCEYSTASFQDLELHIERIHVNPIDLPCAKLLCSVCSYQVPHDKATYMAEHQRVSGHLGNMLFNWRIFLENEEARISNLVNLFLEARVKNDDTKTRRRAGWQKGKPRAKPVSDQTEVLNNPDSVEMEEGKPNLDSQDEENPEDFKEEVKDVPKLPKDPENPYECNQCDRAFSTTRKRNKHRFNTHNIRLCPFCARTLTANNLTKHIRTKHFTGDQRPETPRQCDTCDFKFYSVGHLYRHIITMHSTKEEKDKLRTQAETYKLQGLYFLINKCGMCQATFESTGGLSKHIRKVHKPKKADDTLTNSPLKTEEVLVSSDSPINGSQDEKINLEKKEDSKSKPDDDKEAIAAIPEGDSKLQEQNQKNGYNPRRKYRKRGTRLRHKHKCIMCIASFKLPGGLKRHVFKFHNKDVRIHEVRKEEKSDAKEEIIRGTSEIEESKSILEAIHEMEDIEIKPGDMAVVMKPENDDKPVDIIN